ncbi:hypothetical protein GQ600_15839 [Phytophthora cactorum]|nr:hypothetical protein GQ600_15839 [Phytophthora cactorum]
MFAAFRFLHKVNQKPRVSWCFMTLCHRISRGIHDAACSFTKAAKTNRTAQNNSTTFDASRKEHNLFSVIAGDQQRVEGLKHSIVKEIAKILRDEVSTAQAQLYIAKSATAIG